MATTDDTGSRRIRVVPTVHEVAAVRGWKSIAAALGVSVRTAQRYATEADLPVVVFRHRAWASPEDLDRWMKEHTRHA